MIVLHGDNQVASRLHLVRLKETAGKSGKTPLELSGDTLDLNQLLTNSCSPGLFDSQAVLIIEGLFSRRPSNEKKAVISYLETHPEMDVVIWEPKDVLAQLKKIPVKNVTKFDLPKHVFTFLDTLTLTSLRTALDTTAAEVVLYLLAGQIHKLLLIKIGAAKLPGWQLAKLTPLANRFTDEALTKFQTRLVQIDYRNKTGTLAAGLPGALELLMVSL